MPYRFSETTGYEIKMMKGLSSGEESVMTRLPQLTRFDG
jgi:hypothetical protein